jgi:hypothetical protein
MDSIHFNIPTTDAGYNAATRVWRITTLSELTITEAVEIDGYTQPGASPNHQNKPLGLTTRLKIELHFGYSGIGLTVDYFSRGCVIKGLAFNGLSGDFSTILVLNGTNTVLRGNFFGTDASGNEADANGAAQSSARFLVAFAQVAGGNVIGGPRPEDRNLFAGRSMTALAGVYNTTIQGNLFGTNAAGNARQPLACALVLDANNQVIGNILVSDGNVFTIECEQVFANADVENVFEGNFVGTDVTGARALGDSTTGFGLASDGNRIGGPQRSQRNVISGNRQGAILINGRRNIVQGNLIGTQSNGLMPLPNGFGIKIESGFFFPAEMNMIGGTNPGEGNIIAYNNGIGVSVTAASGNSIRGNSIHSNAGLGIDLATFDVPPRLGVTANDQGDGDEGANGLQNFPVIRSATFQNGLAVSGILNSVPNKTYRIEFFGDRQPNPNGFGEGQTFLDFINVTTDSSGNAAFVKNLTYPRNASVVSATATDSDGNTSEFSHDKVIFNAPGQLINISGRAQVLGGDQVVICGFVLPGTEAKRVIIRGLGPSLMHAGLSGVMDDPALDLYNAAGVVIATNENWRDSQEGTIVATGLSPSDDREAAIVKNLNPGVYTVALRSQNAHSGLGLVELFDLAPDVNADLANLSVRASVGTGDRALIAGLVVSHSSSNVLLRALGPSLAQFGIPNPLVDPTLALYNRNGALIAMNDNWKDTQRMAISSTGLPPTQDAESAILRMLPPSSYTAIVRGKSNSTGIALLEAYNLQ